MAAAAVEYYSTKGKWGWRLRNTAGKIEITHPAIFATQPDAQANAAADTRLEMGALGIIEAATPADAPIEAVDFGGTGGVFS